MYFYFWVLWIIIELVRFFILVRKYYCARYFGSNRKKKITTKKMDNQAFEEVSNAEN
jgi:hypothetical protein